MTSFGVFGVYLNAVIPKTIHLIKIEGESVDIMCEVNPEHKKNVRIESCVRGLYLKLLKYVYICMEYALLWYKLYTKTLKSNGLAVNIYGRYIVNSIIDEKKHTTAQYIDDNKASYIDEEVNTNIIEKIAKPFDEPTVTREKKTNVWGYT